MSPKPATALIIRILLCLLLFIPAAQAQDHLLKERLLKSDPREVIELEPDGQHALLRTATRGLTSGDIRETPANVQIISARQIKASGARDLYEVLQLVPGIAWGNTTDDVMAIAMHGQWAHDGNWLMLLNGEVMNDNDRGGYAIGQRIPIDNIDRIEIILGPGSISHEAQGVLGTINVITRSADRGSHMLASLRTGHANGPTATTMNMSGAYRLGSDQDISFLVSSHRGNRSNMQGLLADGSMISFADSTAIRSAVFQFQYRWRSIKAFMYFEDEDHQVSDLPYSLRSRGVVIGVKQRTSLGKGFELAWRVKLAEQAPGNRMNTTLPGLMASNTIGQRHSLSAVLTYRPFTWSAIRVGTHAYDQATRFSLRDTGAVFPINGERVLPIRNIAAFAEVNINGKFGSITTGGRFEYNTLAGSALAPKISYTKLLGRFHGKLIHGSGFRFPSAMELAFAPDTATITPLHVTTDEAEIGARVDGNVLFTLNAFRTGLARSGAAGAARTSQGVDVRLNWENGDLTAFAGFGMYVIDDGRTDDLLIPQVHQQRSPVAPAQRAVLMIAWNATPSFTLRARGNWRGPIWTFSMEEDGTIALLDHPEETVLHAGLMYRPKESKVSIDLGVANLLGTPIHLFDPSGFDARPFMLNGREYTCSINYRFGK